MQKLGAQRVSAGELAKRPSNDLLMSIGAWTNYKGLPAQRRQMLHKPQGTLYAAAARQGREVVGDHQDFFQTCSRAW